jgi:hypothetical protein
MRCSPTASVRVKSWSKKRRKVVYREIAEDEIAIVAVAYLKRQHRYWSKRQSLRR